MSQRVRVIGGTLKGRRLLAPTGKSTRPTADRTKESVFNILAEDVREQRVLDLYAGTGALGIEAVSRGAASAVLVDRAKAALAAIYRNIRDLNLENQTRIIGWDILKNLNCLKLESREFGLVFMDPPYETNIVVPSLSALLASGALAPGARVVIEHSTREHIPPAVGRLTLVDQRKFGKTLVSFMDFML